MEGIIPPQGGSGISRPAVGPKGGTGTAPTKAARPPTNRQKLDELTGRLCDQVESLTCHPDGTRLAVPVERLPVLAETVRQLAETEAILAGIDHGDG